MSVNEELSVAHYLNDKDIRTALLRTLLPDEPETLVIEEFGVGHGAARADIVVINSHLKAFEIKSDQDNLDRLSHQVHFYNSVFSEVTLVVGYRHAYEALQMVPSWWEVKLAGRMPDGSVEIADARGPGCNPSPDASCVAGLLWRGEALNILEELDCAAGVRSKPRAAIYQRLANVIDIDRLNKVVCNHLKNRENWRADLEPELCDG
jgi:hypothetical protein